MVVGLKISKIECPCVVGHFDSHASLKPLILNAINSQKEFNRVVDKTGLTDITRSDWNTSKLDSEKEWLKILQPELMNYLTKFINVLGYKKFVINEIWFQQYYTNSKHDWHVHSSNWTNVYYLDLPPGSPKTQLKNPMNQEEVFELDVKEGDILTFPSFIIHRAPINFSNKPKTIISWNMNTDVEIDSLY